MPPSASSTGRSTRGSSRRTSWWRSTASQRADQMIIASLASSEGWMRNEPAPSHRVAPLAPDTHAGHEDEGQQHEADAPGTASPRAARGGSAGA